MGYSSIQMTFRPTKHHGASDRHFTCAQRQRVCVVVRQSDRGSNPLVARGCRADKKGGWVGGIRR